MGNAALAPIMNPFSLCQNVPSLDQSEMANQPMKALSGGSLPTTPTTTTTGCIPSERTMRSAFPIHRGLPFRSIYRKARRLGKGSYGEVYLAEEVGIKGRLVAVKDCQVDEAVQSDKATRSYTTEIAALSALPSHPRIIRVFEVRRQPICHQRATSSQC